MSPTLHRSEGASPPESTLPGAVSTPVDGALSASPAPRRAGDRSNEAWVAGCRAGDSGVLSDLRVLLLRALGGALAGRAAESDALAEDFAQDALLLITGHLHQYRGESRFTTWAVKVAVRHATGQLRRRRWADLSLDVLQAHGASVEPPSDAEAADSEVERGEAVAVVRRLVRTALTDRQRQALEAELVHGVSAEVVAEWMGTNRNALYKLMHDARLRLRRALEAEGLTADDLLGVL